MKKVYAYLMLAVLALAMAGCENFDKAIKGIEKGTEVIGAAEKKVTETRESAEKSIGEVLGKDSEKSDTEKSESKEKDENKNKEKE